MVSSRASCISLPVSIRVVPPSCRAAMSKEMRVRVDCLSKIIASTLPSSGRSASGTPLGRPSARLLAAPWRRRSGRAAWRCRDRTDPGNAGAGCSAGAFIGRPLSCGSLPARRRLRSSSATPSRASSSLKVKRRQQPHHIVAGRQHDQAVRARRVDEFAVGHFHLQSQHQALAAHAFEHRRMPATSAPSCWRR